ncbi:uncharacterized protein LOC142974769 [Anticarsia gemmatalis]|uniref:uncharacterized protein LOC142974769 n=1 Tax=Anticarsia gemmatalis TaxID=129554 RepID=UPI003F762BC5
MRVICIILLVITAAMAAHEPKIYDISDAVGLFDRFVNYFIKQYKDDADKIVHYRAFVENLKRMNKHNLEDPNNPQVINHLSDQIIDGETPVYIPNGNHTNN